MNNKNVSITSDTLKNIKKGGRLVLSLINGRFKGMHKKMFTNEKYSNIYCRISCHTNDNNNNNNNGEVLATSPVIAQTTSPEWNWMKSMIINSEYDYINIEIFDDPSTLLGEIKIPLDEIQSYNGECIKYSKKITTSDKIMPRLSKDFIKSGKMVKATGILNFKIEYFRSKFTKESVHVLQPFIEVRQTPHNHKSYYYNHKQGNVSWTRPKSETEIETENKESSTVKTNEPVTIKPIPPSSTLRKSNNNNNNNVRRSYLITTSSSSSSSPKNDKNELEKVADVNETIQIIDKLIQSCKICFFNRKGARAIVTIIKPLHVLLSNSNKNIDFSTMLLSEDLGALLRRLCVLLTETITMVSQFHYRAYISHLFRGAYFGSYVLELERQINQFIFNIRLEAGLHESQHVLTEASSPIRKSIIEESEGEALKQLSPVQPSRERRLSSLVKIDESRIVITQYLETEEYIRNMIEELGGSSSLLLECVKSPWLFEEFASLLGYDPQDFQDELDIFNLELEERRKNLESLLTHVLKEKSHTAAVSDTGRIAELVLRQLCAKKKEDPVSSGESDDEEESLSLVDKDYSPRSEITRSVGFSIYSEKTEQPVTITDNASYQTLFSGKTVQKYKNDSKFWYDFVNKDYISTEYFVNILDLVYNNGKGFDSIIILGLVEILSAYPYTGVVTYEDWAILHRMMRLTTLPPLEALSVLGKGAHSIGMIDAAKWGNPCWLPSSTTLPEESTKEIINVLPIASLSRIVRCSNNEGHRYFGLPTSTFLPLRLPQDPRYYKDVVGSDPPIPVQGHKELVLDYDWEKPDEDENEEEDEIGDISEGSPAKTKTKKETHSPRRSSVLEDSRSNLQTKKRCISFIQPNATNGLQFPVPIYSVKLIN